MTQYYQYPSASLSRPLRGDSQRLSLQETYCKPLRIIGLAAGEQRLEGEVGGDDESGSVDQELAGNVKEDEEEVQSAETEHNVDFWDAGLLLKVVESWVFRQLPVEESVWGSWRNIVWVMTNLSSCERWYCALS